MLGTAEKGFWFVVGLVACTWKGFKLVAGLERDDPDRDHLYDHAYGVLDPRLDPEWFRFVDPARQWHDATNIVVEWFRLNPQRAAKTSCFLIFSGTVLGFLLGVLVAWVV